MNEKKNKVESKSKYIISLSLFSLLIIGCICGLFKKINAGDEISDILLNVGVMLFSLFWVIKDVLALSGHPFKIIRFPIKILADIGLTVFMLCAGIAYICILILLLIDGKYLYAVFFAFMSIGAVFGVHFFIKSTRLHFAAYLAISKLKKSEGVDEKKRNKLIKHLFFKKKKKLNSSGEQLSGSGVNNTISDLNHIRENVTNEQINNKDILDDITYIRDMKHVTAGSWHQYDVLLAARGYGWDNMIEWADYMTQADLKSIDQVTAGALGAQEKNITDSYSRNGSKCSQTPELKTEMGTLSLAGLSATLGAPVKIVWFNQTRVLRFFTLIDDELLITKYVETVIRRTFGTESAMKLAKPIPVDS